MSLTSELLVPVRAGSTYHVSYEECYRCWHRGVQAKRNRIGRMHRAYRAKRRTW
jgi:hypothetical protein